MGKAWRSKEEKMLEELYLEKSNEELAEMFDRTPAAIQSKMSVLGLCRGIKRRYSEKDYAIFSSGEHTIVELAIMYDISVYRVATILREHGARAKHSRRRIRKKDIEVIKEFGELTDSELAKKIGCSIYSVKKVREKIK